MHRMLDAKKGQLLPESRRSCLIPGDDNNFVVSPGQLSQHQGVIAIRDIGEEGWKGERGVILCHPRS